MFTDRSKVVLLLWIIRFICHVFVMLSRLFIAFLWSPAGKGLTSWLTSWLLFVMFNCVFVTSPMWYPGSVVVLDCISLPPFLLNNRADKRVRPAGERTHTNLDVCSSAENQKHIQDM